MQIGLLYAFVATLYVLFFETIVFDDSYDAFISNLSIGQFTPFPMLDLHYLGGIFTRELQIFIQELIPSLNVFASTYILFNVGALALFIYSIHNYLLANKSLWLKHFFSIAISLIFLENIISITHTRFATIVCGLALVHLLKPKSSGKWFWMTLFVFGFLMRPESGIGAILIIGIAASLFWGRPLETAVKFVVPILSIAIFSTVFLVHRHVTDRLEILMEPDIEYALSTNRVIPLAEMGTLEDSIKYQMAVNGSLIDEHFTDIAFLRRITQDQFKFRFAELTVSIVHVFSFYSYYFFFPIFYIASIFLGSLGKRMKLLLYYLIVFAILTYLDYNVAIADRHFLSLQLIVILLPFRYAFNVKAQVSATLANNFYFLLLFAAFYNSNSAINNQREVAKEVACIETGMGEFEKLYQDRFVLIGVSSFHLLDRKYSFFDDKYKGNTYLLYDAMNYSIVPRNRAYLSALCSCDASNTAAFFAWLAYSKALIIMDVNRARIIQEYVDYRFDGAYSLELEVKHDQLIKASCLEQLSINDYFPWVVRKR